MTLDEERLARLRADRESLAAYVSDLKSTAAAPRAVQEKRLSGMEIVKSVKEQLALLTGHGSDTVSAMRFDAEGWHITLEVVELKRIPNTADVLATYETLLDETGNLITYERTRRYLRGQVEH